MTPPANQNIFSPLTLPGEFLYIFYMNYAFDLTQNIAKTNIYTQKINDGRTDDGGPVVANPDSLWVRRVKKLLRK
jgi:hypothetical protein